MNVFPSPGTALLTATRLARGYGEPRAARRLRQQRSLDLAVLFDEAPFLALGRKQPDPAQCVAIDFDVPIRPDTCDFRVRYSVVRALLARLHNLRNATQSELAPDGESACCCPATFAFANARSRALIRPSPSASARQLRRRSTNRTTNTPINARPATANDATPRRLIADAARLGRQANGTEQRQARELTHDVRILKDRPQLSQQIRRRPRRPQNRAKSTISISMAPIRRNRLAPDHGRVDDHELDALAFVGRRD